MLKSVQSFNYLWLQWLEVGYDQPDWGSVPLMFREVGVAPVPVSSREDGIEENVAFVHISCLEEGVASDFHDYSDDDAYKYRNGD